MSTDSRPILYLLTGMHRSGTSLLAKKLFDTGLVFPGDLLAPADDNPEGYWEARQVVQLNNKILNSLGLDWRSPLPIPKAEMNVAVTKFADQAVDVLSAFSHQGANQDCFAVKDPRFCRLLPVWTAAATSAGLDAKILATLRDPAAVSLSLYRRRRDERFRPAAVDTPDAATLLWLRYLLDLDLHSRFTDQKIIEFSHLAELSAPGDIDRLDQKTRQSNVPEGTPPEFWVDAADWLFKALPHRADNGVRTGIEKLRCRLDELWSQATAGPRSEQPLVGARTDARGGAVISFISGEPDGRGHIYRVENRIAALIGQPASVLRVVPGEITPEALVAGSDAIIIFRAAMDTWLDRVFSRASAAGVPTVFDIDDLIFDPDMMQPDVFRYLEGKSSDIVSAWIGKAEGYRLCAQAASMCWVPTTPLREQIARLNPAARILRNGLSDHHTGLPARQEKPVSPSTERDVTIGYASGTPTHDTDFSEAVQALNEVLTRFPGAQLFILGDLADKGLAPLCGHKARIRRSPKVGYFQLTRAISQFDINLAPLERGNIFCDSKSELKFFEAGAAALPTIASATPPFAAAIRSRQNGYLANSFADWVGALERLIVDTEYRVRMGEAAKRTAFENFGPERQKADFLERLSELLPGFSGRMPRG